MRKRHENRGTLGCAVWVVVALSSAAPVAAEPPRRTAATTRASGGPGAALGTPRATVSSAERGARRVETPGPRRVAGPAARLGAPTPRGPRGGQGLGLDLAVGTHLPMSLGGEVTAELPGRLLARVHVGWLPSAYVNLINNVARRRGWYGDETATVVDQTVDDAFVLRSAVGWRPLAGAGLELWIGYTHVRMEGATTAKKLAEAGVMDDASAEGDSVGVSTALHAIHAAIGWRFLLGERFLLRVALGYSNVLGADTDVDGRSESENRRAARRLRRVFTDHVQMLEPRLTFGVRL